jgi:hypothetical protein
MDNILKYARERRDRAYAQYIERTQQYAYDYKLADEQYFMGRWHMALDFVWELEQQPEERQPFDIRDNTTDTLLGE